MRFTWDIDDNSLYLCMGIIDILYRNSKAILSPVQMYSYRHAVVDSSWRIVYSRSRAPRNDIKYKFVERRCRRQFTRFIFGCTWIVPKNKFETYVHSCLIRFWSWWQRWRRCWIQSREFHADETKQDFTNELEHSGSNACQRALVRKR